MKHLNILKRNSRRLTIIGIVIIIIVTSLAVYTQNFDQKRFYNQYHKYSLAELKNRGNKYLQTNHPDSAMACYSIIISSYRDDLSNEEKQQVVGAYNNTGYIYFFYSFDFTQAYSYFLKAREIAEAIGYDRGLGQIWLNIGNIYANYDDDPHTSECYRTSLEYSLRAKDDKTALITFNNLVAGSYSVDSLQSISKEIELVRQHPFNNKTPLLKTTRLLLQAIDTEQANLDSAVNCLRLAIKNVDAENTPERFRFIISTMLSTMLQRHSLYAQSREELHRNIRLAEEEDLLDCKAVAYTNMAASYELTHQDDSVKKYRYLAMEVNDSILNHKRYSVIKDLDAGYKLGKVNEEIHLLSEQRRNQQRIIRIISVASIIIILLLAFVVIKERRLRHSQEMLYRRIQEQINNQITLSPATPAMTSTSEENITNNGKYRRSPLDEQAKDVLCQKVSDILESDEIYKPDFSLDRLAALTDSKNQYLSQIINEKFLKNFNALVSEFRIREACRRLSDESGYGNLTIEAIALGLGFKSRSHFSVTFKRITGFTPGEYIKTSRRVQTRDKKDD
ncbi:MAG: helix-turn-helix domain-containing protein [Lepagella sp.]